MKSCEFHEIPKSCSMGCLPSTSVNKPAPPAWFEMNIFSELQPLIEKFRPQLAISIYHSDPKHQNPAISDLIEMPLKLFKACNNYDFYIKNYSYERWETIMYCIPKEIGFEL